MPLQYDERIWIIGHFNSPFGGERTNWNPAHYERLVALLLDRIFNNPVGKLLHAQIIQRIWIIPYTRDYGGFVKRNATASSTEWMPTGSRREYFQHRVCESLAPWLGSHLMSRAGCRMSPSSLPRGYHYPNSNPPPVDSDRLIEFTPAHWKPSNSCRSCAAPSERRDEVLFHEIFHAIRALLMAHHLVIDLSQENYLKRRDCSDQAVYLYTQSLESRIAA